MTMSDGQYELKRQKASGKNLKVKTRINMNVIDHYNGTERSVRILSGGEAFQPSSLWPLAFPMRLVARRPIQLDAMFVDEGFGSLDREESLNQAVEHGGTGRWKLYGSNLSHVPELKERIERKIVVMKKPKRRPRRKTWRLLNK